MQIGVTLLKATAAGALLGGIALGVFLGTQAVAGPGSPEPTPDFSELPPGATIRYEGDEPVIEAPITPLPTDGPYFKGRLGDFDVVGSDGTLDRAVCPSQFYEDADEEALKSSELYSPALEGISVAGAVCPDDGTVISIEGYVNRMDVGRLYFTGVPQVPYEAPRERLQLLTVAGRPTIAQMPLAIEPPDAAPGVVIHIEDIRLAVIERAPSGESPGVLLWIRANPDIASVDLEAAIALAEEIIASGV